VKHRISSPFGFQHLTHTDRQHFATFEQTSGDRSARTSQKSTQDAAGVIVNELHFSNFSSDNLATREHRLPSQSPQLQQSGITVQEQSTRPSLRLTRSVESFSQPGVNARTHRPSQSVLVPPRQSSLSQRKPVHTADRLHPEDLVRNANRVSGIRSPLALQQVTLNCPVYAMNQYMLGTPSRRLMTPRYQPCQRLSAPA
jgi:hypothetical protein